MLYPLSYEGGDDAERAVKLPSGRCSGRWRRYSRAAEGLRVRMNSYGRWGPRWVRGCGVGAGREGPSGGEADGVGEDPGWDPVAPDAADVAAGAEMPRVGGGDVSGDLVGERVEALGGASDASLAASVELGFPVGVGGLDALTRPVEGTELGVRLADSKEAGPAPVRTGALRQSAGTMIQWPLLVRASAMVSL